MRPPIPNRGKSSSPRTRCVARDVLVACVLALILFPAFASAATYYVDGANPGATDLGSGSSVQPFRTLQAAVTAFGAAGNTIVVRPATYREQVTIAASGTASSAIVLQAAGPGVVVSGADDFSGTTRWAAHAGNVYVASGVTWAPSQVFADGVRLSPATVSPASLPANAFVHVMGAGLYVNVGGANPGSRRLEVGRRVNGFRVTGSYVTVDGFQVMQTEGDGIEVSSATATTIQNCRVSFANQQGIQIAGGTSVVLVRNVVSDNNDHGFYVTTSTNCRLAGNESFRNARPAVRAANGIYLSGSTGCMVEANLCHDNQDSGLQFYNGANNCTSRNNVSWNNGDHGFDHVRASGVRHSNDVAFGNYMDGFSFEGDSPGGALFNCIAVDNGITTGEFDLWVDGTSVSGFQSNDNIIWNSTSQAPIKYITSIYSSVASYAAASGKDTRSIQSNPMFANPAASNFTLSPGSPAIDNANAGAAIWPGADASGVLPFDVAGVPNTGLGTPPFADRGAFEFTAASAPDHAPVVTVPASASVNEAAVMAVNVTASDPDGNAITALTADLSGLPTANNAVFTTNASKTAGTLTWTPSYSDGRATPYTVTFTATNALSGTASTSLTVGNVDRAPAVTAPATATATPGAPFVINVTAADPDNDAIASFTADLSGLPAGHDAAFTANASRTAGTFAWTPRPSDGAGPFTVRFIAANALSAAAQTSLRIDRPPVVTAPATASVNEAAVLMVNVTASDSDGDAITALTANLSGLPASNNAVFTVNASKTAGTLTWTPSYSDARAMPYTVIFTATNALSGATSTSVTVNNTDRAPVVTATPAIATVEGVRAHASVTALDPDGDALTSLTADLSGLPSSSNATFTVNPSKTIGTLTWTPTYADGRGAPYTIAFRAANALSRAEATSITVRDVPPPGTELAVNPGFEAGVGGWTEVGRASLSRTASGHSGGYSGQLEATNGSRNAFSISDAPSTVTFVPTALATYRISAWVRSASASGTITLKVTESLGGSQQGSPALSSPTALSPVWTPISFDYITRAAGSSLDVDVTNAPVSGRESFQIDDVSIKQIANGPVDRPPVVTAFASALVAEGGSLNISVLASDPDKQAVSSFVADLSALSAGHDAVFTANATNALGTLTWTPGNSDGRVAPYIVLFTAANTLRGSAGVAITVQDVPGEPNPVITVKDVNGGSLESDIPPGLTNNVKDIAAGAGLASNTHDIAAGSDLASAAETAAAIVPVPPSLLASSGTPTGFSARVVARPGAAAELKFTTRLAGWARVQVFDVEGRRIGRPLDAFLPAGEHRVPLDANGRAAGMGSGIYFYRLDVADARLQGRFAVVR